MSRPRQASAKGQANRESEEITQSKKKAPSFQDQKKKKKKKISMGKSTWKNAAVSG